jgi:hypothetical protein
MFASELIQWVHPGSGDHDEIKAAMERANPVDTDPGTRCGVARRCSGHPERRAFE